MNYTEYSYKNRNMKFVKELMEYLSGECNISGRGLSIGSEDNAHEDELTKIIHEYISILNNKKEYDAEVQEIPYDNETFDYVFIKSVIEHIANTDLFLSEIYRVLKPGGRVIVLCPDYQKQKDWFYDDYTHIKPFTLVSLKMALLLNNFKIEQARHFWYYRAIWEHRMIPNNLPCRFALWLTQKTGIKYFRWGADRQLFAVGIK